MDTLISSLNNLIPNEWKIALGLVALIFVAIPRLVEFRQGYLDLRLGKRQLELEKLRLEVLKLRLELEQHLVARPSPAIARELEEAAAPPPPPAAAPVPQPARGLLRRVVTRYPWIGRPTMLFVQFAMAYMMVMFAAGTVLIPVMGWSEQNIGPVASIAMALVYAALAWLAYKAFVGSRTIRRELAAL